MPTALITFLRNPDFTVDLFRYAPPKKQQEVPASISQVAFRAIGNCIYLLGVFRGALSHTLRNAHVSFLYTVVGYRSSSDLCPPADIYVAAFNVFAWVANLFQSALINTCEQIIKAPGYLALHLDVEKYCGEDLNPAHLKTSELEIDLSDVPRTVVVDDLLTLFDKVNFTRANAPGYFSEASREGHSPEQLRTNLQLVIRRIKEREAFLGTPPALQPDKLLAFYKTIEGALRFCIHKVNSDIVHFERHHNVQQLDSEKRREYDVLLTAIGRLLLDLALMANFCGARYMGESLQSYFRLQGAENSVKGSLGESLCERLAELRKMIGQRQATVGGGQNTHNLSNWMKYFGAALGIPGTKNVVEYLSGEIRNPEEHLKRFFDEYTADAIIHWVQEYIKSSQAFREQVRDWTRDQEIGPWKRNLYRKQAVETCERVKKILVDQPTELPLDYLVKLQQFTEIVDVAKINGMNSFPIEKDGIASEQSWDAFILEEGWDAFINKLFVQKRVQTWCQSTLKGEVRLETSKNIHALKNFCSEKVLGREVVARLKTSFSSQAPLESRDPVVITALKKHHKMSQIRAIVPLDDETLSRIVEKRTSEDEAVEGYYDRMRRQEFLEAMPLEDMQREGLPLDFMIWMLTAQGIFHVPQSPEEI